MNVTDTVIKRIRENTSRLQRHNVKKALIIIDVETYPIGDSVVFFSKIRALSKYFNGIHFDVLTNKRHYIFLRYFPVIRKFYFDFSEVNVPGYDLVINFSVDDTALAGIVCKEYDRLALNEEPSFGIYNLYAEQGKEDRLLFPYLHEFHSYLLGEYNYTRDFIGHEIHLSDEEIEWGNNWFRQKGLQYNEKVIILLDSTNVRDKLMPIDVYFELVRFFMTLKHTRILVFDPYNNNKKLFYEYMLGADNLENFIFVEPHGLRNDFCLLASDFVHLIFGPCTGILHCTEGIYNVLDNKGKLQREWPLMICYLGPAAVDAVDKWFWWGETHVDCLYIDHIIKSPEQYIVKKLDGPGRLGLPCSEFKAAPLIRYIREHYGPRLKNWQMI